MVLWCIWRLVWVGFWEMVDLVADFVGDGWVCVDARNVFGGLGKFSVCFSGGDSPDSILLKKPSPLHHPHHLLFSHFNSNGVYKQNFLILHIENVFHHKQNSSSHESLHFLRWQVKSTPSENSSESPRIGGFFIATKPLLHLLRLPIQFLFFSKIAMTFIPSVLVSQYSIVYSLPIMIGSLT